MIKTRKERIKFEFNAADSNKWSKTLMFIEKLNQLVDSNVGPMKCLKIKTDTTESY